MEVQTLAGKEPQRERSMETLATDLLGAEKEKTLEGDARGSPKKDQEEG